MWFLRRHGKPSSRVQALWKSEKLSHFILRESAMVTCLLLLLLCHKCFRIKMLMLGVQLRFSVLLQAYGEILASQNFRKLGYHFMLVLVKQEMKPFSISA